MSVGGVLMRTRLLATPTGASNPLGPSSLPWEVFSWGFENPTPIQQKLRNAADTYTYGFVDELSVTANGGPLQRPGAEALCRRPGVLNWKEEKEHWMWIKTESSLTRLD